MVSASIAVNYGLETRSGQTKDYAISICYFFARNTALRSKSKDWFVWNQYNMWGDMSTSSVVSVSLTELAPSNQAYWSSTT